MDIRMLQAMQQKVKTAQNAIENKEVSGDAGGGAVSITINGSGSKMISISINEEMINKEDKAMLEDLIVAAFNNAKKNAESVSATEMGKVGIPPELLKFM